MNRPAQAPRGAASRHAVGRRGGRLARLRALGRVARRDVRRSPGRTALVAGLTFLPVAVATMLIVNFVTLARPATVDDLVPASVQAVLSWRAQPVLQDGPLAYDVFPVDGGRELEPDDFDAAAGMTVLDELVPLDDTIVLDGCTSHEYSDGSLHGIEACELAADPGHRVAALTGRLPVAVREIAVADPTLSIGDVVTVRVMPAAGYGYVDADVTVVGTLDPGLFGQRAIVSEPLDEPLAADATLGYSFGPEATFLVLGTPLGWDRMVELNAAGFAGPSRAAAADPPSPETIPYALAGYESLPSGPSDDTLGTVALVAVGVGLVLVLTIAPAHVVGVRRRAREFALLAVTGASPRDLRHVVMLGAALQGCVAAVAGIAAGLAAVVVGEAISPGWAGGTTRTDLAYSTPYIALLAVVVIATVMLAAWAPGRTAGKLNLVAVLGGRRAEPRQPVRLQVLGGVLAITGLTAVMATSAALVVGVIVGTSLDARELGARYHAAGDGRVVVDLSVNGSVRPPLAPGNDVAADIEVLLADVRAADPAARRTVVHGLGNDLGQLTTEDAPDSAESAITVLARTAPGKACPVAAGVGGAVDASVDASVDDDTLRRAQREDPRCDPRISEWEQGTGWAVPTLIDDGTVLAALGLPNVEDAVAALAAGRVVDSRDAVVTDNASGEPGGIVTLDAVRYDGTVEASVTTAGLYVPGLEPLGRITILPPAIAATLGVATEPVGIVVEPSSDATRTAVAAALRAQVGSLHVKIEDWTTTTYGPYVRGLVGAGLVLGIGTALLILLLLAAETRPDLAVLTAVGAAPRTRRRLAAAQSGALVGTGVGLGTLVGLVVSAAVILARVDRAALYDPSWQVVVPWGWLGALVVGLVAGAWATGWFSTRSRMPLPSEVR